MSWYKAGTVTSLAGTNIITGTGTLWNNPIFGIASGQMIFVPGAGQVVIYEILAVDSDTKIRVTKNISSAITNSEYAIVTTVSNSMSDLARRTAVQLALYQGLLEDWQLITTGTGNVTIIAPDGTEVVIPSLAQLSQDISNKISQQQLSVIGIGLLNQSDIANFDWQNFVFTAGANYVTTYNTWVNPPAGITYNAGTRVSIRVIYISNIAAGPRMGLEITPDTNSAANFKVYKLLCVGAAGSRVFTFNQDWNSAIPIPITGGGTGATTLAGAQSALGIVTDAFGAGQVSGTPWVNMTLYNGWTVLGANNRCRYRKVLGMVFMEFAAAGGTVSTITTLPVGYRPLVSVIAPAVGTPASISSISPRLTIDAAGGVTADGYAAGSPITAVFCFSLQ
ncbi:hypothetical protein [Yersinia mollaretii]|uniref:hypothetical protein n=1 Tax=Yersinia mollaretii TaxID=33060 RepID=UPI00211DF94C|nr:hypothetical protein [Yersinia mollaretii]MDA5527098.1 hypothetical protein [Yersinia mollaretii]WQC73002.1 hypothetical protein U1Z61_10905 [Yersinia mollaretii]